MISKINQWLKKISKKLFVQYTTTTMRTSKTPKFNQMCFRNSTSLANWTPRNNSVFTYGGKTVIKTLLLLTSRIKLSVWAQEQIRNTNGGQTILQQAQVLLCIRSRKLLIGHV